MRYRGFSLALVDFGKVVYSLHTYLILQIMSSLLLNKTAREGEIGYHPMCKEIGLTHLIFADDIMVFIDRKATYLSGVMEVLYTYGLISGLKINAEKSSLFITGKTNDNFIQAATTIGFPIEQLPIRYLGLPLTTKSMTKLDYEPVIDRNRTKFFNGQTK